MNRESLKCINVICLLGFLISLPFHTEAMDRSNLASQPELAFGLEHRALANTELLPDEDGGLLVVPMDKEEISGFEITLTEPQVFSLSFDEGIAAGQAPEGALHGSVARTREGRLLGSVVGVVQGDRCINTIDFTPIRATGLRIVIMDGPNVVEEVVKGDPTFDLIDDFMPEIVGMAVLEDGSLCIMNMWTKSVQFFLEEGTVTGTQVLMISSGGFPLRPGDIGQADILLRQLDTRIIVDETLTVFGNVHRALGTAQLRLKENPHQLDIYARDSLASVAVALGEGVTGYDKSFIMRRGVGHGGPSQLQFDVEGDEDGWAGSALFEQNGDAIVLSADFSGSGATSYTLKVLRNGALIATYSTNNGMVGAFLDKWPLSASLSLNENGFTDIRFKIIENNLPFPNGTSAKGDEVLLCPDDPNITNSSLKSVELLVSDVDLLRITDEKVHTSSQ